MEEDRILGCNSDAIVKLDSSCQAKIHAGPGRMKPAGPNAPQDPEVKFIFDMDLSMGGNTPCTLSAAALETLHGHGTRIFEGAITAPPAAGHGSQLILPRTNSPQSVRQRSASPVFCRIYSQNVRFLCRSEAALDCVFDAHFSAGSSISG